MYKHLILVIVLSGCASEPPPNTVDPKQARLAYEWAREVRERRINEDQRIQALIESAHVLYACYENEPGKQDCIRVPLRK